MTTIGITKMDDTERLDYMIFYSAKVCHSSDADDCWVTWWDREGEYHRSGASGDARKCIDDFIRIVSM